MFQLHLTYSLVHWNHLSNNFSSQIQNTCSSVLIILPASKSPNRCIMIRELKELSETISKLHYRLLLMPSNMHTFSSNSVAKLYIKQFPLSLKWHFIIQAAFDTWLNCMTSFLSKIAYTIYLFAQPGSISLISYLLLEFNGYTSSCYWNTGY